MDKKEEARKRAKEWYNANKERALEYAKNIPKEKLEERYAKRKEVYHANRDALLEKRRLKNADNEEYKAKNREKARLYREANREKIRASHKKTREKHKDKVRTRQHNYRVKKRAAFIETIDFRVVFTRDKGVCHICKKITTTEKVNGEMPSNYATIDHEIPINKGGLHCYENVKIACKNCNSAKSDHIPPEGIQMNLFAQPGIVQKKVKKKQTPEDKKAYMKVWREKNKESQKEKGLQRRLSKRPENWEPRTKFAHLPKEERKKIYYERYHEKKKDEINAKNRERRAKNKALGIKEWKPDPEVSKAYFKAYNEKNRERKAAYDRERRKKLAKSQPEA